MKTLNETLRRIYQRPDMPQPWQNDGTLPWNDPAFSERMLREHLDESHGAASRRADARQAQITWLWQKLGLQAGRHLYDITCGPGLYAVPFAERGCQVTGVDFSPASIAYAKELAIAYEVAERCTFIEQDVRRVDFSADTFDAALFLYGQLAVFPQAEAQRLLAQIARSLKPGASLCLEMLNQARVDKEPSSWWFTDDKGLWGKRPFLHLGERFWDADNQISTERYQIIDLETGTLQEITLSDQTYSMATMTQMLKDAGFTAVTVYPAWDGLDLYDADEWMVYLARV